MRGFSFAVETSAQMVSQAASKSGRTYDSRLSVSHVNENASTESIAVLPVDVVVHRKRVCCQNRIIALAFTTNHDILFYAIYKLMEFCNFFDTLNSVYIDT